MNDCPLCLNTNSQLYCRSDVNRTYNRCDICALVFAVNEATLSADEEKSRYTLHENELEQPGYRNYLKTMWQVIYPKLKTIKLEKSQQLIGLDFGCGPTQALQQYAKEYNIEVKSYDPYFFNEPNLLESQYHFAWCSEVFEHFNQPRKSIEQILKTIKPLGLLAVRTELYPAASEFEKWYYQRDPTHVVFYNQDTMNWLAQHWGLKLDIISKNICIFEILAGTTSISNLYTL